MEGRSLLFVALSLPTVAAVVLTKVFPSGCERLIESKNEIGWTYLHFPLWKQGRWECLRRSSGASATTTSIWLFRRLGWMSRCDQPGVFFLLKTVGKARANICINGPPNIHFYKSFMSSPLLPPQRGVRIYNNGKLEGVGRLREGDYRKRNKRL